MDSEIVRSDGGDSTPDPSREIEFALMEMKAESLGKIDEAIRRLEAGVYGVCAECGTEIAEARLKALPFATLCVACQEREENERADVREAGRVHEPAPLR